MCFGMSGCRMPVAVAMTAYGVFKQGICLMKSVFISLLEGFLWVVVIAIVITAALMATKGGFGLPRGAVGGLIGAFIGMCAAAVLCGPGFVLLNMNENLQKLVAKEQ